MSQQQTVFDSIRTNPLFRGLSEEQILKVTALTKEVQFKSGEFLMKEGEVGQTFYVIHSGSVEIIKKGKKEEIRLNVLSKGDTVGELALLGGKTRAASVRSLGDSSMLKLNVEDLQTALKDPLVSALISGNLSNRLTAHLYNTNETAVEALEKELASTKLQAMTGRFIVSIFILLVSFTFALNIVTKSIHRAGVGVWFTMPALLFLLILLLFGMRNSGYPKSFFGFTLHNWRGALLTSFLYTLPILIFCTLAKWMAIIYVPAFHSLSLFSMGQSVAMKGASNGIILFMAGMYIFFSAPIQECIFRGGLQSLLQNFLLGKHRIFFSILVSNLLFATIHLEFSAVFALLAFGGGVVWGWIYFRTNSLIAPIFSHMLIGFWMLFVLGIQSMVIQAST